MWIFEKLMKIKTSEMESIIKKNKNKMMRNQYGKNWNYERNNDD